MDIVSYILSKKYTDQTVDGLGAIKGAPCTVQSIVDITDGKRVTLAWESNSGVEQTQSFDIMNGEDGDTIEWNQIQRSGTKIAEVVINGSTTNVYAPNGGGGAGGGHTIIDPVGNNMDQEDGLQFTGNVAVSDDSENSKTVINIPQEVVSLTQAQYNALPSSKLTDGKIYCISDSVGGVDGYPPLIYSDEEREVGVWRDGKPLYQKTYSVDNVGSSSVLVDSSMNLTNIDLVGFINNGLKMNSPYSGEVFQLGLATSAMLRIWNSSSGLYCNIEGVGSGITGTCRFTVQYTKTTDTAGSGIWNGQGGIAHHYSTDEHVIGTWIDGKPLYERTFALTSGITIGGYTNIALDTTINKIKNLDGYIERSNGAVDKINGYTQSDDTARMAIRAGKIEVYISSDFTSVSELWVTIQYTKTTD